MPSRPKSAAQKFDSGWQQTVAWAQSQGIGPSSYLPVYQLDATRMQTGEYQMGRAERNLSILAAHNPNQVTSAPTDNPQPSHVWGNVVSDAGKIATGIEGIFTGSFEHQLWDSAKATYNGVVHPGTLEGHDLGSTIGNWLNDTLLSFLPGAADIGTVLQHDPTLTGSAGGRALAQHPLLSILDLMPGAGGGVERIARAAGAVGVADRLAARGGARSAFQEIGSQIGQATLGGKPGVTLKGQLAQKLSASDRLQNMAAQVGKTSWGVGPAISGLMASLHGAGAMSTDMYLWLLDRPTQLLKQMGKRGDEGVKDLEVVKKALDTYRTTGGDSVREALDSPNVSPVVKDLLKSWMDGPQRFATEEEILSGNLHAIHTTEGRVGLYAGSGGGTRRVLAAGRLRQMAHSHFLSTLDELDPLVQRTAHLNEMLPKAVGQFDQSLRAARQHVFDDPSLQTPITRPIEAHQTAVRGRSVPGSTRARRLTGLSKKDQLHAVVDEGGIADQFIEQVRRTRDPGQIEEIAKAMKSRLSSWGPRSVNAADHPELMALHQLADGFERWAKLYRKNAARIDKAIHGGVADRQRNFDEQMAWREQQRGILRDRQKRAGEDLMKGYQTTKAKGAGKLAQLIDHESEQLVWRFELFERETEAAGHRATSAEVAKMVKAERIRKYEARQQSTARIKAARRQMEADNKLAWRTYQRDRLKLTRDNTAEMTRFTKDLTGEKQGMGDQLAEAVRLGKAVRAFHDAVYDHPPDQYKNVYRALMERHMVTQIETSELARLTDEYLHNIPEMTHKRLAEIQHDPQVLTEYAMTYFDEIMNQPDLEPEVAAAARDEMRQYSEDAREELKLLVGQGLKVPYIPSATAYDERLGRNSMAPLVGHGIPKPDMAKAKVWEFTPHKEDFALGINKAVVQALQRDATIHLVEDTLRPMTLSRKQVAEFAAAVFKLEDREFGGNLPHEIAMVASEKLGLTAVNFEKLFGFGLPRHGTEEVYLPTPIVRALEQVEKQRTGNLLKTSNKVFRYSILGLSPRYTAHVLFGGTMMLALRSSPYAITFIGKAAKALRDGTVPHNILRENVEMGFAEPINMVQTRVGQDLGRMTVGEHIEQRQGIKAAAAKPIHVLRAMADINFRFVRYVRDMQATVAFLDGAAKAERKIGGKIEVEDPESGRMMMVTPERAIKEGMHHVQQVFGNLHAMSPFERQVAQTVMPFYGWQKHILGYVMSFPFDHPWRALILSQMAFNTSQSTPLAYPIRINLLMPLGTPDKNGNTDAIDIRSLDPFRDVANYGTTTGFFESLNPALGAALSIPFGSQATYGESSLYPNVTYNAFYGIQQAGNQGSWVNALEQWTPQVGAVVSALQSTSAVRSQWTTNRSGAIKSMLSSMNIPFVTPPINLKQIAAKDEAARFQSASKAAYNAFSSGDFSGLQGYKSVPYPLNTAYEVSPQQLEQLYNQALQQNPGVAPIETLVPPQTPYGW